MLTAVNQSRKSLSIQLNNLTNVFKSYAIVVDEQKKLITNKVKFIGGSSLLLFVLMVAFSTSLQFKTLRVIAQLLPFFDALTAGDFSKPLKTQ